jgi:type IV pilus assembly protein PilV
MLKAVSNPRTRQGGVSLIEVLVSVVIVVLGLLGLAGLQSHATLAEMEAFQRAQALVLLQDMVDRVNANRLTKVIYTTGPVGTGNTVQSCNLLIGMERDHCEWGNALLGVAETSSAGKVGAMLGARGCVDMVKGTMPREYLISVVWQGLSKTKEPSTPCGAGQYGDDRQRRAVTATVVVACLQNNPATGLCLYPQE